jgi:DNA-binding transcriptional LysR family regulator
MDVTALRVFIEVVRRGSFAAVARDHDMDPSAISRTIAALERDLGARLFHRTTRRLAPTEAGTAYFERVEPLLEELDRANLVIGEATEKPKGTLRVTASVSFGQERLIPMLPRFAAAYSDLGIDLLLSDAMIDIVAERFDVAVRHGRLADSSLVASRLLRTRYVVCASPDYLARSLPLAKPQDLRRHECLRLPFPGFHSRWIFQTASGERVEVPVTGRITISTAAALKRCALDGLGPALLPSWLIADEIESSALVDVFPGCEATATDFDTAIWFLHPSRSYVPLKVKVFRDFLKRELRERQPKRR